MQGHSKFLLIGLKPRKISDSKFRNWLLDPVKTTLLMAGAERRARKVQAQKVSWLTEKKFRHVYKHRNNDIQDGICSE